MNSIILAGVSFYFSKYFLSELREVSKKVEQLDDKVRILSGQTDSQKSNLSQPGNREKQFISTVNHHQTEIDIRRISAVTSMVDYENIDCPGVVKW